MKPKDKTGIKKIAMVSLARFIFANEEAEQKGEKRRKDRAVLVFQGVDIDILEKHRYTAPANLVELETNKDQMARFCEKIAAIKDELDCVIVYLERLPETWKFLEMAKEYELPPDKVVFLLCLNEYGEKLNLINQFGYHSHKIIECGYGCFRKMRELYFKFLSSGNVAGD